MSKQPKVKHSVANLTEVRGLIESRKLAFPIELSGFSGVIRITINNEIALETRGRLLFENCGNHKAANDVKVLQLE